MTGNHIHFFWKNTSLSSTPQPFLSYPLNTLSTLYFSFPFILSSNGPFRVREIRSNKRDENSYSDSEEYSRGVRRVNVINKVKRVVTLSFPSSVLFVNPTCEFLKVRKGCTPLIIAPEDPGWRLDGQCRDTSEGTRNKSSKQISLLLSGSTTDLLFHVCFQHRVPDTVTLVCC